MRTESAASTTQQIAAGYAVDGKALELGSVVVNGTAARPRISASPSRP